MNWYYAEQGKQQGPVDEAEMRRLIAQGTISSGSLVWNATMTDWRPLAATPLGAAGAPPENHERCVVSGRIFPKAEMMQTEHGWVSAEAKEKYLQCLREGVWPTLNATAGATAWRDGKYVVVQTVDAVLPSRCIKTNVPVGPNEFQRRNLFWVHGAIFLTILLSWLITVVLYFVLRKKVTLTYPISSEALRAVRLHTGIAWALVIVGLGAIFVPLILGLASEVVGMSVVGGILVLLTGAIWGSIKGRLLRVAKLKGNLAWIGGAHPEFVASLPPYVG